MLRSIFQLKENREHWYSNPGLLGEKRECYLCAIPPPPQTITELMTKLVIWDEAIVLTMRAWIRAWKIAPWKFVLLGLFFISDGLYAITTWSPGTRNSFQFPTSSSIASPHSSWQPTSETWAWADSSKNFDLFAVSKAGMGPSSSSKARAFKKTGVKDSNTFKYLRL